MTDNPILAPIRQPKDIDAAPQHKTLAEFFGPAAGLEAFAKGRISQSWAN